MSCFLLNEASTFALNTNFYLASLGENWKGRIYKLNGILLFITFFVARIAFNLYVIGVMIYTWSSLHPIFLSNEFPYLFTTSVSIPPLMLVNCTILSTLAIGHATINLVSHKRIQLL